MLHFLDLFLSTKFVHDVKSRSVVYVFLRSMQISYVLSSIYIYLYYFAGDTVALPNDKVYDFRQGEGLISRSVHKKIINQIFPLHDPVILENLKEGWIKRMIKMPPIDDIS